MPKDNAPVVGRIEYGTGLLIAAPPFTPDLEISEGRYILRDPSLDLIAHGPSLSEAIEDFEDEVLMVWECYAISNDPMASCAVALKNQALSRLTFVENV